MFLATEDELSEIVGLRLAEESGLAITDPLRKGGNGYLRSKLANFCGMARGVPVLVLTDLDTAACPVALINSWKGRLTFPDNLVFRIAVREVESWLLADTEGMAALLEIPSARLPRAPETLADPKRELLALASRAPRAIRSELVADRGALASQGLGYNRILGDFVRNQWCPARAAECAPSLARARRRISELAARI